MPTPAPREEREQAVRLYMSGLTARQTAERMGYAECTILDWVRQAGCTRKPGYQPGRRRGRVDPLRAVEMRRAGLSYNAIGRTFGVSKQGARDIVKRWETVVRDTDR